ncbi:Uncharacterised protein [BD1-7 clade bacterium]|uniref:Amidohydrolase-related domain-containing protein n=1 Tax=BD1-7 clade bacterium TaxID=2029982 RepID=A0A5S9QWV1_9GAMM|nr:Uncharacterised protein [BD1-7 clade bacterium]
MSVIDVWMQHPTERFLQQPFFDSLRRWMGNDFTTIPLEFTLQSLADADIEKALICAWYGPQGSLISNDEVATLVDTYPDKFAGVASVDIRDPVEAVRTLKHYVLEKGFVGLRIVQWVWEIPATHALYYPLFAACVELDVPVCLQVGLTGPLRSSESGRPAHIERIALDFPELTIVCGHIGYPWYDEMIAFATKFPNVYIDTSAYKTKRYPATLVEYMKRNGRQKVLFGSNYPMLTPQQCLQDIDQLELDDETRQCFLYDNAKRIFNI